MSGPHDDHRWGTTVRGSQRVTQQRWRTARGMKVDPGLCGTLHGTLFLVGITLRGGGEGGQKIMFQTQNSLTLYLPQIQKFPKGRETKALDPANSLSSACSSEDAVPS